MAAHESDVCGRCTADGKQAKGAWRTQRGLLTALSECGEKQNEEEEHENSCALFLRSQTRGIAAQEASAWRAECTVRVMRATELVGQAARKMLDKCLFRCKHKVFSTFPVFRVQEFASLHCAWCHHSPFPLRVSSSAELSGSVLNPKKIARRFDLSQRKVEDKAGALASQLPKVSLAVKSSSTNIILQDSGASEKGCLYYRKPGHFSSTSPRNGQRNKKCPRCEKEVHFESLCFPKLIKNARSAIAATGLYAEIHR